MVPEAEAGTSWEAAAPADESRPGLTPLSARRPGSRAASFTGWQGLAKSSGAPDELGQAWGMLGQPIMGAVRKNRWLEDENRRLRDAVARRRSHLHSLKAQVDATWSGRGVSASSDDKGRAMQPGLPMDLSTSNLSVASSSSTGANGFRDQPEKGNASPLPAVASTPMFGASGQSDDVLPDFPDFPIPSVPADVRQHIQQHVQQATQSQLHVPPQHFPQQAAHQQHQQMPQQAQHVAQQPQQMLQQTQQASQQQQIPQPQQPHMPLQTQQGPQQMPQQPQMSQTQQLAQQHIPQQQQQMPQHQAIPQLQQVSQPPMHQQSQMQPLPQAPPPLAQLPGAPRSTALEDTLREVFDSIGTTPPPKPLTPREERPQSKRSMALSRSESYPAALMSVAMGVEGCNKDVQGYGNPDEYRNWRSWSLKPDAASRDPSVASSGRHDG